MCLEQFAPEIRATRGMLTMRRLDRFCSIQRVVAQDGVGVHHAS